MATDVPKIPANFKPYRLIFFDKSGRSVYTETCSFLPDRKYIKERAFYVFIRLLRKGKKDVKEFSIGVVESNVTMMGRVKDFMELK